MQHPLFLNLQLRKPCSASILRYFLTSVIIEERKERKRGREGRRAKTPPFIFLDVWSFHLPQSGVPMNVKLDVRVRVYVCVCVCVCLRDEDKDDDDAEEEEEEEDEAEETEEEDEEEEKEEEEEEEVEVLFVGVRVCCLVELLPRASRDVKSWSQFLRKSTSRSTYRIRLCVVIVHS